MSTLRLPGLVDAHVHLREPGMTHKEDIYTGTVAALVGGVTTVLDMPNSLPPVSTPEQFQRKARLASAGTVCDIGLFVGATTEDQDAYLPVAEQACALKIYVNETFGSLRIDELGLLHRLFRSWAEKADEVGYRMDGAARGLGPIAVHAEELAVPVCVSLADLYGVPLHVVHVSRRSEIEFLRRAKENGLRVSCEVTPHHLFMSAEDAERLGPLGDMRPRLASPDDVSALWENLDVVDIFATDHAPHTLGEKLAESATPPPGVPGVETMLPLLLTAVNEERLALDDIVERCVAGPRRIYGLPEQADTFIEVDIDTPYALGHDQMQTKCGWTPFAGLEVIGRVERVTIRGEVAVEGGEVRAARGSGDVLFWQEGPES